MAIISRSSLTVVLVVLCVAAICLDSVEAGRKGRGRKRQGRDKSQCKYRPSKTKECDPETNTRNLTLTRRRGDEETCPETKVIALSCRKKAGCEYDGKVADWTECDPITSRRMLVKQLAEGSPSTCPPTHIKVKRCKKAGRGRKKVDRLRRKKARKVARKVARKEARKERKKAKKEKKGKKPKQRRQRRMRKGKDCKYKRGRWYPCYPGKQTRKREMVLVSGDSVHCQPRKFVSRPCKNVRPTQPPARDESENCEYEEGNWSACDNATQTIVRIDLFLGEVYGSSPCKRVRINRKKCKKACKYTLDDWSECDPVTDKRSRVKRLTEGDNTVCEQEMTLARPCRDKHGVERCFFGNWGEFGPCTNGVSTKVRPLLQGGVECERKAVITKACEM